MNGKGGITINPEPKPEPDYSGYDKLQLIDLLKERDKELNHKQLFIAELLTENRNLRRRMGLYEEWAKKVQESLGVLVTLK